MLKIFRCLENSYNIDGIKASLYSSTPLLNDFASQFNNDHNKLLKEMIKSFSVTPMLDEDYVNNSLILQLVQSLISKKLIPSTLLSELIEEYGIDNELFNSFIDSLLENGNMNYTLIDLYSLKNNINTYTYIASKMLSKDTHSATYILNKSGLNEIMLSLIDYDDTVIAELNDLKLTVLLYK